MSDDLDKRLRAALRPIDPGEDFTARVLSRVAAGDPPAEQRQDEAAQDAPWASPRGSRLAWLPAALAASILAVVVVRHEREVRREEQGLAARAQVLEALRVTSSKLDLAFHMVNGTPPPRDPAGGAS